MAALGPLLGRSWELLGRSRVLEVRSVFGVVGTCFGAISGHKYMERHKTRIRPAHTDVGGVFWSLQGLVGWSWSPLTPPAASEQLRP